MLSRNLAAALVTTSIVAVATPAYAQTQEFNIPAGSLKTALDAYAKQTGRQVIYKMDEVQRVRSPGVSGPRTADAALNAILAGTGFRANTDRSGAIAIVKVASATVVASPPTPTPVIVVTGTNIRGAAPVGAPLQQFDRADIAETGATTVQEFVETLPQNFGGGVSDDGQIGSPTGGTVSPEAGAGVNLRGLGNGSTLVLLNGNRLAASGSGSFVDVSMIPLSAVERIDVLTDGASAIYGTDAVSGVVNIVLRDDFDGAETVARFGTVTDGGLRDYRFSQTFGKSWETGRALLSYDYSNRSELLTQERVFTEGALDPSNLLPNQERHSVLGSVYQDLGDRLTVFATGLYSDRSFDGVDTSGFLGTSALVGDTQQLNLAAGINVDLGGDWVSDLSGSYSAADVSTLTEIPQFNATIRSEGKTELVVIDAKVSGTLFDAPGGPVRVAIGGQYRRDDLRSNSETVFFGSSTVTSGNLARDVYAAYGEVLFPIVGENNSSPLINRFHVSLAGRYEEYSDFGSSLDPRVGMLFEPAEGLRLRGSWGTSFRAPLLRDLDDSSAVAQAVNSPIAPQFFDPQNPTGTTPLILLVGNNSGLTEETSTAWTLGVDFEPKSVPGLRASLTYFNIRFEDRISTPAAGVEVFEAFSASRFEPFLTRNPNAQVIDSLFAEPGFLNPFGLSATDIGAIFDNRNQNFSATEVDGFDYSIRYGFDTDIGQINLQSSGSYYLEFANQFTDDTPSVSIVDTVFNPVDFKMRNSVSWANDGISGVLAVNYVDGYTDNVATPATEIDSWTTVDLQLAYRIGKDSGISWLRNTEFLFNVDNLFDEDPPLVLGRSTSFSFDSANANPIGRFVSFQISKRW